MKKIAILLLIIIILAVIFYAVLDRPTSENLDYRGFSLEKYYSFDTAQEYDTDIYYIGIDSMLYRVDAIYGDVVFYPEQMKYFAITRDLLIYVDAKDYLHIVLLYQFIDKTMQLDTNSYEDCIVTNKGIVYKDTDDTLCYLEFINWRKSIIIDDKIDDFAPYEGEIAFSTRGGEDSVYFKLLSPSDGSVRSVTRRQMESFVPIHGYIYYSVANSIYRINIKSAMSERLVVGSDILGFEVSDSSLLCRVNEERLELYDLRVGKIREINGENINIIDSKDDEYLCFDSELNNITLVSSAGDITIGSVSDAQVLDVGFAGDYIFVQIGDRIDGSFIVEDMKFYDMMGNEVYAR